MGPLVQQVPSPCRKCSGAGSCSKMKTEREVLQIFIEKGTPDGHKIIVHGKADEAPESEPGDVVVIVRVKEHPRFLRRDADLFMEHEVSLAEALTGFRCVVQHLDGRKLIVHSKPGEVLQPTSGSLTLKGVRGAGMPIHQDPFNFGSLFLVLTISFPMALPQKSQVAVMALDALGDDIEEVYAEDIDPIESAKLSSKKVSEAYEEDQEGPGMQAVECKQQ